MKFKNHKGNFRAKIGDVIEINLSFQGVLIEITIDYIVINTGFKKIKFCYDDMAYVRFFDEKLFQYRLEDKKNG